MINDVGAVQATGTGLIRDYSGVRRVWPGIQWWKGGIA